MGVPSGVHPPQTSPRPLLFPPEGSGAPHTKLGALLWPRAGPTQAACLESGAASGEGTWTGERACGGGGGVGCGCGWGLHPNPSFCLALCLQLFNIYPWLGALFQLHRPVLRKIEEVRAILRTLLKARRPSMPGGGPVQSYMDALIQQGQVWARSTLPPKRPGGIWGPRVGVGFMLVLLQPLHLPAGGSL